MFCTKCGNSVTDDTQFCTKCGGRVMLGSSNTVTSDSAPNHFDAQEPIGAHRFVVPDRTISAASYATEGASPLRLIVLGGLATLAAAAMVAYIIMPRGSPDEGFVQLDQIATRWNDGIDLAGHTRRNSLSGPVQNLQAIKQDLEKLKVSACMSDAKAHLNRYMDGTISTYLEFMGGADYATPVALKTEMDAYQTARQRCAAFR